MAIFDDRLSDGLRDYCLLLDRGYPQKGSLQLVGDRYRLTSDQRNVLFRGGSRSEDARRRALKRVPLSDCGSVLQVDGYNVLYAILSYLLGRPVFVSRDGYLRDIGGVRGRVLQEGKFIEGADGLFSFLKIALPPGVSLTVLLDEPVDRSRQHAARIRLAAQTYGVQATCRVERSVDAALIAASPGTTVAGSDSRIIDNTQASVVDLAFEFLHSVYNIDPPRISPDLSESGE